MSLFNLDTQLHTVCTGIESLAQCNATASTSILRPFCSLFTQGFSPERKREVGLKLNVGGTVSIDATANYLFGNQDPKNKNNHYHFFKDTESLLFLEN